jgi:hypothetical protein
MKLRMFGLLTTMSILATGAYAQNGAGSGPPQNAPAPAPTLTVPVPAVLLLLPIRIAATSIQVDSHAIIDAQRRTARRAAARTGRNA